MAILRSCVLSHMCVVSSILRKFGFLTLTYIHCVDIDISLLDKEQVTENEND